MSDNIIKMFIGGEEVVSNKEFTINEEMLSASSTILNNCYPATWEESKDYVSNFYYPKDYSKFILGKGNFTYGTDQYSILSVSGETFMQFETNVEKEWNSFNVYGNTTQGTISLPNEYTQVDYIESSGTEYINTGYKINKATDKVIIEAEITRESGSHFAFGTYDNNNYYGLNFINTSTALYIYNSGASPTTSIQYSGNTKTKYEFSSSALIINNATTTFTAGTGNTTNNCYLFSASKNNGNIVFPIVMKLYSCEIYNNNILVRKFVPCYRNHDNEVGLYDLVNNTFYTNQGTGAFTYGNVLPNPENPSELVSVGYENLVEETLTGMNINNSGQITRASFDMFVAKVEKDKTYTISVDDITGVVCGFFTSKPTLNSISYNNARLIQQGNMIVTAPITGYIAFRGTSGYQYAQITRGTQAHTYIPYGKYGIEIKVQGKNLHNGVSTNKYAVSSTGEIRNGNAKDLGFENKILVQPNTTYTVKFYDVLGTYPFFYSTYDNYNNFIRRIQISSTNGTATFTIDSNTHYIFCWLYSTSDIFTTVGTNIQMEKGTQATEYEPYKENTQLYQLDEPLRAINDIKDRLYIENGMLFAERKIGSIVLNGSENGWNVFRDNDLHYNYYIHRDDISKTVISCLSNYFKYKTSGDNSIGEFQIGGNNPNKNGNIVFNPFNDTTNELTNFKTWLSTHNTEVQYPLAEPHTEVIGQFDIPYSYEGINNITFDTGIDTEETIYYYWKNYDILFAGIVKNSGDISLRPTNPKYCSLQILDYKTFLSESDTLDFVISDKTIAEAISMVVDAISGYGFVLGTINISQADDIIGAYSTLNKTAYDVFQYLANISGSRWRARFVDSDTMAIDFYDPELLPRANDIDYTQQYWEDNKIVDLTFNYGTRDYRNKQIILSDEVYGGIDYTEVLLSNGYGTSYITQNNIANITSITVNGVEAEVITQSEKDLGVDADFYYTPGKNVVESTTSYTAGTQIIITYTPLVKGRQIVYNDEEVTRIATQTNTTGVISRYESRNDILSSDELENIAESYIKYKGKPEIILKLTTLNNDLFNIGEICYFNSPIADLAQDYMVKSKATNYTSVAGETNIFYTYELTSSFNSEKAINYFDNQRNKATGNIAEGESITRNIDINNSAMIIWENATITEISVSVDGDNALNSVLNSPFIQ